MPSSIYLVAGEASGDVHGAQLISALRRAHSDLVIHGLGGPRMREAGGEGIRDWLDRAAVMGYAEVIKNFRWFRGQFRRTVEEVSTLKPAALILIDYPGFNLRLAKALRPVLPGMKIVQYVAPQVWAWKEGRIPQMAKCLDLVLCIFPFEPRLFEDVKLPARFIGHPLIDELGRVARVPREERLVALLPGSRRNEVERIFPVMLQAGAILLEKNPGMRFVSSAASSQGEGIMRELLGKYPLRSVDISVGCAREVMQRASCGLVTSGTATLEAAYFGLPYALVYRMATPVYLLGKAIMGSRLSHIGIVNILAGRGVVPEFIQGKAAPHVLAGHLQSLLDNADERERLSADLQSVVGTLGEGGFNKRAEREISKLLSLASEGAAESENQLHA